jgi:hypothetical protein
LEIQKNSDGSITISTPNFSKNVWLRSKPPQEKFEAVRAAILEAGFAFTGKIEKKVRKELNMP